MKYKNIIWDFDGTLFDTYPVLSAAFEAALKSADIFEPAENIEKLMKVSMGYAIDKMKEKYSIGEDLLTVFKNNRYAMEEKLVHPFDGAEDICRLVFMNNGRNFLYTHRGKSSVYFIEKFKMNQYFTDFITSENNFSRRPCPDAIIYLVNKYNMINDDTLMVGDRDLDMLATANANINIHSCFFSESDSFTCADYNISNLRELYDLLEINN